ncbi:hypothetical protein KUTeg_017704 [Tegillarca granosa]|uniref:DNA-directed DNA polymerase n=1 Tax=Tegillarca granosa TaxID=220873 RepID=A0ABQ9EJQ9_TEGGR|nr:hypothetical protein KUTeg_017704 [Tegillarca granosa]
MTLVTLQRFVTMVTLVTLWQLCSDCHDSGDSAEICDYGDTCDTVATLQFPHPVTLAGMLEMGTAYLPVNENWFRYINQSNAIYNDLQRELKMSLMKLANDACEMLHNEEYKYDPWLFDLDWSVADFKLKKEKPKPKSSNKVVEEVNEKEEDTVSKVLETASRISKVPTRLAGYPRWYRDLCPKPNAENWAPGPSLISTQTRVTPKLLRLMWDGFPVHYHEQHAWGYIVPDSEKAEKDLEDPNSQRTEDMINEPHYPVKAAFGLCNEPCSDRLGEVISEDRYDQMLRTGHAKLDTSGMLWEEKSRHLSQAGIRPRNFKTEDQIDINIPGCWFIKLPHKDGPGKNVGNPLAKDFQSKVEEDILHVYAGGGAARALKLGKICSYWKNNQKRIESQMVVGLKKSELSKAVARSDQYEEDKFYGAIIPRIADRIGSELKSIIQAPPGYHFVGADVDSQELWIAAIIGDSHAKIHGCTAFGWMTLQGTKADKTDLHSKTAETVGITRDHAKVFNYGRIYGAGQKFAETLLMQFNHKLTADQAKKKAKVMYSTTKGKRRLSSGKWDGGSLLIINFDLSESEMFNRLEEIATSFEPVTPVLGCHISKALEPDYVGADSVAFFSAVDIDQCLRKEVTMDCKTPSNPHGMERGYGIPQGISLHLFIMFKI